MIHVRPLDEGERAELNQKARPFFGSSVFSLRIDPGTSRQP